MRGLPTYVCKGCRDLWVDRGDGVPVLVAYPSLESRVLAIEERQRAYGMHDPECPEHQWEISDRTSSLPSTTRARLDREKCNCWLREDW